MAPSTEVTYQRLVAALGIGLWVSTVTETQQQAMFVNFSLLMVYLRNRRNTPLGRMHALTLVTLFLTFDLVLFGAFKIGRAHV